MAETVQTIKLSALLLDVENPRHSDQKSQHCAIEAIAKDQELKLARIAEDIAINGFDPSANLIVLKKGSDYVVLEGNRRLAAVKLLTNSNLLRAINLPPRMKKDFERLHNKYPDNLPTDINCIVFNDRADAEHWIRLRHTGENNGVGIVPWGSVAADRFRKKASVALQALTLARESTYLSSDLQQHTGHSFPLTTLERLLGTKSIKENLGIKIINGTLELPDGRQEEALGRIVLMVEDLATKLKTVTDFKDVNQRNVYGAELLTRKLPTNKDKSSIISKPAITPVGKKSSPQKIAPLKRETLVPKSFILTIEKQRLNDIFDELRRLNVESYKKRHRRLVQGLS